MIKTTSPSIKEKLFIISFFLIPNTYFLLLSLYFDLARPLLNTDYLVSSLFLISPWRTLKKVGALLLILAAAIDSLMLIIQVFPFINISSIIYFTPFILSAPIKYIVYISLGSIMAFSLITIDLKLSKKIEQHTLINVFLAIIALIITFPFQYLGIKYKETGGILARGNYYIANSQAKLYNSLSSDKFNISMNTAPQLIKNTQKSAQSYLAKDKNNKIIYILAESWGALRNPQAQTDIIKKITEQKNNLDFIHHGSFTAYGATISGELRELCNLEIANSGFSMQKAEDFNLKNCLPNQLLKKDYKTLAVHGASGLIYDRNNWYSRAGFSEIIFAENIINSKRCTAFKGVCDFEIINIISNKAKQYEKNSFLFYWLTLTAHQPYAIKDIINHRFQCTKYDMNEHGDACLNSKLNTQLMDNIADLIKKPHMKGIEFIIVGDHEPPMWGGENNHIIPLTVSYLHFKTKDNTDNRVE